MNTRKIWTQWCIHRKTTAEIARQLKLDECDVDRVIARCMNAQHDGTAMPFEKARA